MAWHSVGPKERKRKRRAVIRNWGLKCFYCGMKLIEEEMTIDHFHPVAAGGTNAISNLRPACEPCNRSKGSAVPL
jgi:5-methylcytosine-specific restriction endonuclease McrA